MPSILTCRTKADLRGFEAVPERLHRMEPAYIPPAPGAVVKFLKKDSSFQKLHGEIRSFIAHRNGVPAGRIAGIVNRSHNNYYGDKVGFFGFFACEENLETSRALFAEVEKFLKEKGLTHIRGPYNPSVNEECGLLVDSFQCAPFIGMPWNPSYYEKLVLDNGFQVVRRLYAYLLSTSVPMPKRVERVTQRIARRGSWTIRPMNLSKLKEEIAIIHRLYNETLNRNWGFVPIALEDLETATQELKLIADPQIINFVEKDGEPVGFAVCFPNINDLLAKTKKTPAGILRSLHLLGLIKTQRPKHSRLAILGVAPAYRDRGINAWLFYEQLMRAKKGGYESTELSWIEENNQEIIRGIELMGGKKYRTYHLYEKML
ncbi:MAG: hypothetical protein C5B47_03025 [Verrucomicrobia bacterium]|nr:MAG: hypothetical protein C5B47_03025 [Verrucomicrobiota bacterium]